MWTNSYRELFVLQGNDAKFYTELCQNLLENLTEFTDDVNQKDDYSERTGCVIFDNATPKQKIFLLNFCLKHLLSEHLSAPEINHILEAAAYFPFAFLEGEIKREVARQMEMINAETGVWEDNYYKDYYFLTYYRRKTYEIYKTNIISFSIAYDIIEPSSSEYETLKEQQEYYKKILEFNHESTEMERWSDIINQLAHDLVLGDDEDFRITSHNPQVVDGNSWTEENMGIADNYFTNRLPKVTDAEYEEALTNIFSYEF